MIEEQAAMPIRRNEAVSKSMTFQVPRYQEVTTSRNIPSSRAVMHMHEQASDARALPDSHRFRVLQPNQRYHDSPVTHSRKVALFEPSIRYRSQDFDFERIFGP